MSSNSRRGQRCTVNPVHRQQAQHRTCLAHSLLCTCQCLRRVVFRRHNQTENTEAAQATSSCDVQYSARDYHTTALSRVSTQSLAATDPRCHGNGWRQAGTLPPGRKLSRAEREKRVMGELVQRQSGRPLGSSALSAATPLCHRRSCRRDGCHVPLRCVLGERSGAPLKAGRRGVVEVGCRVAKRTGVWVDEIFPPRGFLHGICMVSDAHSHTHLELMLACFSPSPRSHIAPASAIPQREFRCSQSQFFFISWSDGKRTPVCHFLKMWLNQLWQKPEAGGSVLWLCGWHCGSMTSAGVFCLDPTSPSVCLVSLWFCLSLSCPRRSCVCGFVSGLLGWMGQSLVSVVLSQPCRQSHVSDLVSVLPKSVPSLCDLVSVLPTSVLSLCDLVSVLPTSVPSLCDLVSVLPASVPSLCGFVSVLPVSVPSLCGFVSILPASVPSLWFCLSPAHVTESLVYWLTGSKTPSHYLLTVTFLCGLVSVLPKSVQCLSV